MKKYKCLETRAAGAKGTKRLMKKYKNLLIQVRILRDLKTGERIQTVELIEK